MSVENTESTEGGEIEVKPVNGALQDQQRLNGLSNGHIEDTSSNKHKSSSKDKHRDKERDKDYKSSKSSTRDKESDRHKSSSSSSKDKHRDKDRDKDKEKDREKDRDKEKDKHKSSSHKPSSRDKDREKEKERNKDRDREKDKDREKDRSKDKDRHREKERSKDKSDRDHEKRDSDKEKERKKEHKSSSRDKEKSESSSSKDKEKDRHRSSKDKHSSSSSRSKEKDRERHSSSRDKERQREKEKREKLETIVENGRQQFEESEDVKNTKDIKEIKELEIPRNDYDQSCSGFPLKEELENNAAVKDGYECKVVLKEESNFNMSQASSCDYSLSQFRDDEPPFEVKSEATDDSQGNAENDTFEDNAQDNYSREIKQETDVIARENQGSYRQQDGNYLPEDDDEDIPLAKRRAVKEEVDSDDDVPLVSRKKLKVEKTEKKEKKEKKAKKKKRDEIEDDYLDEEKPKKKKMKKEKTKAETKTTESPTKGGRKKKEEEPEDVWKWWEEEKREDGVKWTFLEHKGPIFAPEYEPLPDKVKFYYDGKQMKLSQDAEEIACFYAKMLNHDYVTKKIFNDNFFKDWRKSMTSKEKDVIRDLSKCNFKEMHEYFLALSEKNKNRTKEEKQALKEANEKLIQEYGYCVIDGHKERIGNFKLEPPGLFRGRGEHPKMGLVKKRIMPEEVSINCSKDSKIPQPPPGHKWKEVRHDNTVTWLASWVENVQGQVKYIMLNPSSKLKGEKDYQKYEVARRLDKHIDQIRTTYREEWKSKEMRIRQRGVALYFIDKLALRAGNEKDEDQADTVGCCSLRVEHVQLHKALNGKENVVVFDFLGKDSIRYYNEVEVEKRVFKNLELFMENKKEGDDLFDRLNTAVLNEHLRELMEGLTAKVFRTYNASITLQNQLDLLTDPDASVPEKLLAYNRANRAVAVLCNHQRSIPKSHAKSMENLKEKIRAKREAVQETQAELKDLQKQAKRGSVKEKLNADKKAKQLERLKEQLKKLELQETDRDENKTIALGTSKLNYLDPRISVAWCKKHGVPIEKIFNKTQREKFRWAIHMADENYRF